MIGVYLNIDQPIITLSGEITSTSAAFYFFILVFVFIPIGLINLMVTPLEVINTSRRFKRKWHAFFEGIKT